MSQLPLFPHANEMLNFWASCVVLPETIKACPVAGESLRTEIKFNIFQEVSWDACKHGKATKQTENPFLEYMEVVFEIC